MSDDDASGGFTRRELGRRVATGVAGAGAIGVGGSQVAPRLSPVGRAKAVAPLVAAGAVGVAYVAGVAHERYFSGSDGDPEAAINFERHLRLYNDAREISEVTDEMIVASIERDARNLKAKARETAIIDLYNLVVEGNATESEAESVAQDAIDRVMAVPQKDIATRLNSLFSGPAKEADNKGVLEAVHTIESNTTLSLDTWGTYEHAFFDGEAFDLEAVHHLAGSSDLPYYHAQPFAYGDYGGEGTFEYNGAFYYNSSGEHSPDDRAADQLRIVEPDPADYDGVNAEDYDLSTVNGPQTLIDGQEYFFALKAVHDSRDELYAEVSDLVANHFTAIEAGELTLQDLMSPEALDETIQNAETWGELALYFRQLGLQEAEQPGLVEIDVSEIDEIDGDTAEVHGLLGWSIPSTVDDTTLPIGAQVDPEAYPGEIRMAAEYDDADGETTADLIHLTNPFTITKVDGDVSEQLNFESREVVTPDTNPDKAAEIFNENREANETAEDRTVTVVTEGGGGGGGVEEAIDNLIAAAANAAVYGVLLLIAAGAAIAGAKQVGSN